MWSLSGQFFNIIISGIKNNPPVSYQTPATSSVHLLSIGAFRLSFHTINPLPQFSSVLDYFSLTLK